MSCFPNLFINSKQCLRISKWNCTLKNCLEFRKMSPCSKFVQQFFSPGFQFFPKNWNIVRASKKYLLYMFFFKYVQIWIKDPTKNPFATVSGHLLWMTSLQWTFTLCWTRSLQWTDTLQCIIGYLRRPNRERASVFARLLDATSEGQTEAPGLPEYVVLPLPQNVRPFLTLQRK